MKHVPFGKYAGTHVADLSSNYLLWITSQKFVAKNHPELLVSLTNEIFDRLSDDYLIEELLKP